MSRFKYLCMDRRRLKRNLRKYLTDYNKPRKEAYAASTWQELCNSIQLTGSKNKLYNSARIKRAKWSI